MILLAERGQQLFRSLPQRPLEPLEPLDAFVELPVALLPRVEIGKNRR